jgi:hypothetical protein
MAGASVLPRGQSDGKIQIKAAAEISEHRSKNTRGQACWPNKDCSQSQRADKARREWKIRAFQAYLCRHASSPGCVRTGLATLCPIPRPWNRQGDQRYGASACDQNGPAVRSRRSVWLQPPKIKHAVLDYSDDCELLEIIMPADFATVELE